MSQLMNLLLSIEATEIILSENKDKLNRLRHAAIHAFNNDQADSFIRSDAAVPNVVNYSNAYWEIIDDTLHIFYGGQTLKRRLQVYSKRADGTIGRYLDNGVEFVCVYTQHTAEGTCYILNNELRLREKTKWQEES